uniref:Integrase, catalytic region, zinc finger, CCHC-type, peptidase aspartic, catalytic n=1 Tax=Tanacetum cinerariifolium TaxID=118510 RepID=A0A6L2JHP0_TANCI|nr:integrase, catalytic region, zinc finger, CCHC-type, peptidase aspartic, catalytic [Tanacetum cinerariifolium]
MLFPMELIALLDLFCSSSLLKIEFYGLDVAGSVRNTARYERKCKSPVLWAKIRESWLIGPELVQETSDTVVPIKERLKVARDRQKSYADNRHKLLEFETILLGLPEDIYAAIDSCETAQEIWLRVQQMMKGSDIGIQKKKAKLFNEWERFTSTDGESIKSYYHQWSRHVTIVHQTKNLHTTDYTQLYDLLKYNQKEVDDLKVERLGRTQDLLALMATSNNPYTFPVLHQDQPSFNQNYMQQTMLNSEDITDPTTAMNMALALMAKSFKLNYSTPTNNNQRISSNPCNRQIAQPDMNMGQDKQMKMVEVIQNAVQNPRIQNVGNQNGLIGVQGNANQNLNGNDNLVAARAEGNATRHNSNQIRCYNCRGLAEEFDLLAAAADLDEIEEVNANCILMANLQQASTSGTQTDKALVYDSDGSAVLREELYFSNTSKMANVSKPISIPNEEFSDDTTPSVARKFLNEVKSTIVTLQRVVKQRMALDTHNWSSSAHQELHKIVKDEIFPIVNQVNARVQNFEIQFLKEAAKFVGDFKSLAKEADESFAKHKTLELEIERLLRVVVSQDIMSVVQNNSVGEISNLQTELEHTKERFENCIIKKENEYAKLWNDWYKKCEECKFDKILYDKAYNDMQQKIERLLENENVELEFQVLNYAKENAHLKTTYKNQFDSISVTQTQTKTIIDPLQNKLHDTIYENARLRPQLFDKVSDQKDTTRGTSVNTKFAKQSILGKPPKVGETHALLKPVTSNSIPTPQGSKVMKNVKVIASGMFRINPFKPSKEENHVPNKVRASVRTNPVTVSSNTKNDRVPSAFKSSQNKNKEVEVEEHHRELLLSRNKKHMSSECNNVKLATHNVKSKVFYAMCKQCLISVNHDACLLNYVNGMTSRGKIIASSESESQSDCSKGDNACTSNPLEPTIKWFPNSTFSLAGYPNMFMFLGTVRFRNDHIAAILGFSDLQWGNILITRLYFVKGLGHNLFSIGQFCDLNLEVAFRRNTCFVKNLEGVDLLKENRTTNLYTINLHEMVSASPICLIAHASSTKLWLWQQRLSHLNFDTINDLTKKDLVFGLPKYKYPKEHLCPSLLASLTKCLLSEHLKQNGVVERRNWTLVETARTMLIFSRASLFLWAEAIATVCFTQNRSIIHLRFNKTPYKLINGIKPDISFFHVFGALCYPKNDREDIGKLGAKGDIGFFIGYSVDSCAFRVSGLDLTYAPLTITTKQPTEGDLDLLFEAMYDDYIGGQPSAALRIVPATQAHHIRQTTTTSTLIADIAPTPTNSSSQDTIFPNTSQDVDGLNLQQQHAQQQGY